MTQIDEDEREKADRELTTIVCRLIKELRAKNMSDGEILDIIESILA